MIAKPGQAGADLTHVDAWVFDLDNTLYPAEINLFSQVDHRMGEFIAKELGISYEDARIIQKKYYRDHGTTLNGLMTIHDMPPEDFLDYVHDIDVSEVKPSAELDQILGTLPGRKIVFTNGSFAHAERIVAALDVGHHFDEIYDIAAAGYSPKHLPETFSNFVKTAGFDPQRAAMFDDLAKNLVPASDLGLTTIWIKTETDWGAPRDPDAPPVENLDHIDFEAPSLLSFLKSMTYKKHQ